MAKKKTSAELKAQYLQELTAAYVYWSSLGTTEADEYAENYERMINMVTTPEEDGK